MSDDELLALARKCLAGDSPEAIGRALVEFRAVLGPEETIALIERHRAERERLTRERDELRMAAAIEAKEGDKARAALAAVRAEQRACKASAIAGPKEIDNAKG